MIRFHFLNVGKGDCTIIEHPSGHISIVDINNAKTISDEKQSLLKEYYTSNPYQFETYDQFVKNTRDSLEDPIAYYKKYFNGKAIFRFISTHPDMDHLSGLYRLAYQEKIKVSNFWHTNHDKDFTEDDFKTSPYDHNDWLAYKHMASGGHGATSLILRQGARNKYFNHDDQGGYGDSIFIWAPNEKLEGLASDQEKYNHVSYVLSVEHAGKKVILGGDGYGHEDHFPENTWTEILSWLGVDFNLEAVALKAAHHGHENGYHGGAVKRINPQYTIVSDGYGTAGSRTDLYRQWSKVLSTFWCGNIILEIDDTGSVRAYTQRNQFNSNTTNSNGYYLVPTT